MKRQLTFLKMSLVGLFLTGAGMAKADVYYICAGTELNIAAGNVNTGEAVIWDIIDVGTGNSITGYPTAASTTNTTFNNIFTQPGEFTIKLNKLSAAPEECISDPAEHTVYVLPAFSVSITGDNQYCAEDAASTTLTATVTPEDPFTAPDVVYQYQWYESDASNTQGTALGTDQTQDVAGISTSGDYYYTVKATYGLDGTATGTWLGTPCEDNADAAAHIDVLDAPDTPTITITAN